MKRQVKVTINDCDLYLPVSMRIIEIIEGVHDCNINYAIVSMQNPAAIKVTRLADIFAQWVTTEQLEDIGMKRRDLREYVYQASIEQIAALSGAVMGAALHFRRDITGEEMDTLASGGSLSDPESEPEEMPEPEKKSSPRKKRQRKSTA